MQCQKWLNKHITVKKVDGLEPAEGKRPNNKQPEMYLSRESG